MATGNLSWNEVEARLRSELSVEAFIAMLIAQSSDSRGQPYWLCTNDEARQEALSRFRTVYDQWVALELSTAKTRFEIEQEALTGGPRQVG